MLLNQNSELYLKRTSEGLSKAYLKKHFPIYIKIKKNPHRRWVLVYIFGSHKERCREIPLKSQSKRIDKVANRLDLQVVMDGRNKRRDGSLYTPNFVSRDKMVSNESMN